MADVAPGPGTLAGRDRELATLRGWLAEALGGGGRLAVLTGPPGIGKTRLAEELAAAARSPMACGRCGTGAGQDEAAPPLWPWRRVLNTLSGADTWARITGGEADGRREFRRSGGGPVPGGRGRSGRADGRRRSRPACSSCWRICTRRSDLAVPVARAGGQTSRESRLLVVATCRDVADGPVAGFAGRSGPAAWPEPAAARPAPRGRRRDRHPAAAAGVNVDTDLAEAPSRPGRRATRFTSARWPGSWQSVGPPQLDADSGGAHRGQQRRGEPSGYLIAPPRPGPQDPSAAVAAASVLGGDFNSSPPDLVKYLGGTAGRPRLARCRRQQPAGWLRRCPGRPGWWRFTHALLRDGVYASLTEAQRTRLAPAGRRSAGTTGTETCRPRRGDRRASAPRGCAPALRTCASAAHWAQAAAAAATLRARLRGRRPVSGHGGDRGSSAPGKR